MVSTKRAASGLYVLLAVLCLAIASPAIFAQNDAPSDPSVAGPTDGPLQPNTDVARVRQIDNDTILRMAKAGLGDDILIQTIQLQPGHYDTTPDDLILLKQAGLSDPVIATMQAHGTGLAVRSELHSRTLPMHEASLVNPVPISMGIDEVGVYYKSKDGEWIPLKNERVTLKSGGTVKSLLTHGIVSRDMNGHIEGAKSSLILPTGVEILIYAPEGIDVSEYDFLRFREHSDNREFRTLTGGVFHSTQDVNKNNVPFEQKKLAKHIYSVILPPGMGKGEYAFLAADLTGTSATGSRGKAYTFHVTE
jgi:hypothetical protein